MRGQLTRGFVALALLTVGLVTVAPSGAAETTEACPDPAACVTITEDHFGGEDTDCEANGDYWGSTTVEASSATPAGTVLVYADGTRVCTSQGSTDAVTVAAGVVNSPAGTHFVSASWSSQPAEDNCSIFVGTSESFDEYDCPAGQSPPALPWGQFVPDEAP